MNAITLTLHQVRVLGAMVEKQYTTPANYPMTPNAVRVACNQKNNRDPVLEMDDNDVFDTLKSLEKLGLATSGLLDNTQTVKYKHTLMQALGLAKGEVAILCELFNRGPQTPGELRGRCDRLHSFADLPELQTCLHQLVEKKLVMMLERIPGTKENRWGHLLSGIPAVPAATAAASAPGVSDRIAELEAQIAQLRERLEALEAKVNHIA